jgi:hypothetical protein
VSPNDDRSVELNDPDALTDTPCTHSQLLKSLFHRMMFAQVFETGLPAEVTRPFTFEPVSAIFAVSCAPAPAEHEDTVDTCASVIEQIVFVNL